MLAKQEDRFRDEHIDDRTNVEQRPEQLIEEDNGADGQPRLADWSGLVARIQAGDALAMEELYNIFSKGIRFYLCRQLGPQELDDKVHDTFLIVVQTIQKGELRDPERLMGFVRTIVRRQVAAHIDEVVHLRKEKLDVDTDVTVPDRRRNPEEKAIGLETENLMVR